MKLEFISPADLPANMCPHRQSIALYSHDGGDTSNRDDGLYIVNHWQPTTIERHLTPPEHWANFTFHHVECMDCKEDFTHRLEII